MRGRQAHRSGTFVLSLLMAIIGVGLIAEAFSARGGAISARLLLGVLFIAAGCGRTWVELRRGGRS
jgi:hypothetical protein